MGLSQLALWNASAKRFDVNTHVATRVTTEGLQAGLHGCLHTEQLTESDTEYRWLITHERGGARLRVMLEDLSVPEYGLPQLVQ